MVTSLIQRFWSVLDMAEIFRAAYPYNILKMLSELERITKDKEVTDEDRKEVTGPLRELVPGFCKRFELDDVATRLQELTAAMEHGLDVSGQPLDLAIEAKVLRELIKSALSNRLLLFIPPHKAKVLFQDRWFSVESYEAYPTARDDMMGARMCYAVDQNTASVFHSVRVAEHAMRSLAIKLKVKTKRPLEHEEWGKVLEALEKKLNALRASKRGAKRERQIRFFASAFRHLQFLNDLWRREVAHARNAAPYSEHQALDALQHVRDLLNLLVEGFGPRKQRPPGEIVPPVE